MSTGPHFRTPVAGAGAGFGSGSAHCSASALAACLLFRRSTCLRVWASRAVAARRGLVRSRPSPTTGTGCSATREMGAPAATGKARCGREDEWRRMV